MPIKIRQIERRAEINAKARIRAIAYELRQPIEQELAVLNTILNTAKGLKDLSKRDKKDLVIIEGARDRLKEKLSRLHPENFSSEEWSRIYKEELFKLQYRSKPAGELLKECHLACLAHLHGMLSGRIRTRSQIQKSKKIAQSLRRKYLAALKRNPGVDLYGHRGFPPKVSA